MRIYTNPDREIVDSVRKALADNDWYCPCQLEKTKDTQCMCKSFLEMESGQCHCGLYIKEK